MDSATIPQQRPRQARSPQPRQIIQSRKARPRSFAMSHERRPRYDHTLRPPRGAASRSPSPASSAASTEASSTSASERESDSSYTTDFDDLYDVSDDDSAIVHIKCSNSIKALLSKNDIKRESLPSLVIPSPSAWPTIEKLQSAKDEIPPVPPTFPLSPQALRKLATQNLRVPGANSTPSLDGGSSASDEPASISPSTPDLQARAEELDWDPPLQLTEQAMETLQHLSPDSESNPDEEIPIIHSAAEERSNEMQERGLNISFMSSPPPRPGHARPPRLSLGLSPSEPVSAISVPSPGGFFSNLDGQAKRTWSWAQAPDQQPSTTTAECFYDVPWNHHIDQVKERVLQLASPTGTGSEGPPTARQEQFVRRPSEEQVGPHEMIIRPGRRYDYDEEYETKLHATASSNMSRTSLWLNAQEQYLSALKSSNPLNAKEPQMRPVTPQDNLITSPSDSLPGNLVSPNRKLVRFAPLASPFKPKTPLTALRIPQTTPQPSDPLFYHAFQHLLFHARSTDAHAMRHLRADALQAQRLHLPDVHRKQLLGMYSLPAPPAPDKDFGHLPNAPNDPAVQKRREETARVDRERKALSQLNLGVWFLEAYKFLSGGSLLPRAAADALDAARSRDQAPRVLDLGGLPVADWGWGVALEQRDARVYTAQVSQDDPEGYGEDGAHWSTHRTPSNHRVLTVSCPWRLPFPSQSFDVVSARSLASLCRTVKPKAAPASMTPTSAVKSPLEEFDFPFASDFSGANRGALPDPKSTGVERFSDEFVATLAEIKRILKPNGVLCYEHLDAEVIPSNIAPLPTAARKDSAVSMPPTSALPVPSTTTTRQDKRKDLHARTVEAAVSMRQQQFDPSAGHRSVSRLIEAGFKKSSVRETSIELPIAGPEDAIGAISEVVGGVKWERMMLDTVGEEYLKGFAEGVEATRKASKGQGVPSQWSFRERKGWVINA